MDWFPSQLEKKCLSQLDDVSNWRLLKREKPSPEIILGWQPFRPIFRFNFLVFSVLILVLTLGFTFGLGATLSEVIQPESIIGIGLFVGFSGSLMGFISASLYRRSWNRRAKWLTNQEEVK